MKSMNAETLVYTDGAPIVPQGIIPVKYFQLKTAI